jgi:uncharacterized protein
MAQSAGTNASDKSALDPCPICGRAATLATRPFCSKRCADVDLARWLGEAYRVPATEEDDAFSEPRDA